MQRKLENYRIITETGFIDGDLLIDQGKIAGIVPKEYGAAPSLRILPGFFDVHTHGAVGYDFTTCKSVEEVEKILRFYESEGVTSVFPTLLTERDEVLYRQLELLYEASIRNPIIKGFHMEGPFLSKEYKGAQLESCLQLPSVAKCEEYLKHAHGLLRYMTIAPELPGSEETIRFLVNHGVHVSMGHSGASFDETTRGYKAGATSVTHCFNAMKPLSHHAPSIVAAALYYEGLYAECILDGEHVHPEMVEFLRREKGNDHVVGITDSLMCAGLPDGEYEIGNTPIVVKGLDCRIKATGVRAGSGLAMLQGFRNIKKFSGLTDSEASKILGLNAARMLHMDSRIGSLEVGKTADFIVLGEGDTLLETSIGGQTVYKR